MYCVLSLKLLLPYYWILYEDKAGCAAVLLIFLDMLKLIEILTLVFEFEYPR